MAIFWDKNTLFICEVVSAGFSKRKVNLMCEVNNNIVNLQFVTTRAFCRELNFYNVRTANKNEDS